MWGRGSQGGWGQRTEMELGLTVRVGYLETLESLPGVGLVGLVHQLSHLLWAARLTLLIYWVYPAPCTPTCTHTGILYNVQSGKSHQRNVKPEQLSDTLLRQNAESGVVDALFLW